MAKFKTYNEVVKTAWTKHLELYPMTLSYACIFSMHAVARYAFENQDQEIIDRLKKELTPFVTGEVPDVNGVYGKTLYRFGGSASAYMLYKGLMPEAKETLCKSAELLINEQFRDLQGIFAMPGYSNFIWIDTVFAVCPFFVYMGHVTGDKRYFDEAFKQMMGHHVRLRDPEYRTYHQASNARGQLGWSSMWSRGQGWGVHGLIDIILDLPKEHPGYQPVVEAFLDTMSGTLNLMDENGMYHQVMNDHATYPETSGTGMIAYALGRGIEAGVIPADIGVPYFIRTVKGMLDYIDEDGSVDNCCPGCLATGNGKDIDYASKWWVRNDRHAFGGYIHAFAAADALCRKGGIPPLAEIMA